jgi:hypothetical protein
MGRAAEKRLVQLATRQFGVVSARDLVECGVSRRWMRRRIETGEWIRIHRGVFTHGSNKPNLDQLDMAALLAGGERAVLSHTSAARRLGLDVPRDEPIRITVPASRNRRRLAGVQMRRSQSLIEKDITRRGRFRMTHLARTVLDLASVLDDGWLRAAFDSALRQRKTNIAWISQTLHRRGRGRRGADRLRKLVGEYRRGDEVPDSVLESMGVELARATGRKPKLHWAVLDGARLIAEVDFAWPEVRLCVELDGWAQHGTRAAFGQDRARDRALVRLGWMVLRYTWQDVTSDPESVIGELATTYESRADSLRAEARSRRLRRHAVRGY